MSSFKEKLVAEIKYDIRRGADIYRSIYGTRLQTWISTGKIKRGDILVWRSGLSGWRKAEELEELVPFFEKRGKLELKRISRRKTRREVLPQRRQIRDILIVDDEKDMCSILQDVLSERKYNVSIANTKRDATAFLRRKLPDLVFLDLKLPDGDGIKLLSKIKKISPRIAVNIISAYGSEETKEEAKKRGAYSFIDKPFTERKILDSISRLSRTKRGL